MSGVAAMAVYHRGVRTRLRKMSPGRLVQSARASMSDHVIIVDWVNRGRVKENWGDAIAPLLAFRLSGKQPVNNRDIFNPRDRPVFTTIGSMLGVIDAPNVTVWGTGFVDSRASVQRGDLDVRAVRGPMSRQKLIDSGIKCPDVYGDPALLFPLLYRPQAVREYSLGIIPHFKEQSMPAVQQLMHQDDVLIIDIRGGVKHVVDQINRCERIASSSLHGLVAADAYQVPAIWVRFSDRPAGDGFKFRDYLASTGTRGGEPLFISEEVGVAAIHANFSDEVPQHEIDRFLDACPFLNRDHLRRTGPGPAQDGSAGLEAFG